MSVETKRTTIPTPIEYADFKSGTKYSDEFGIRALAAAAPDQGSVERMTRGYMDAFAPTKYRRQLPTPERLRYVIMAVRRDIVRAA